MRSTRAIGRPASPPGCARLNDIEPDGRSTPGGAVVVDRDLLARRDVPDRGELLGPGPDIVVAGVGPERVVVERAVAEGKGHLPFAPGEAVVRKARLLQALRE